MAKVVFPPIDPDYLDILKRAGFTAGPAGTKYAGAWGKADIFGPLPWTVSKPTAPDTPAAPETFVRMFGERDKPHGGNSTVLQIDQDRWDGLLAAYVGEAELTSEFLGDVGVAECALYGLVPVVYRSTFRGQAEWFVSFEKQQARWFQYSGWISAIDISTTIAKYQESLMLTWGIVPDVLFPFHAPGLYVAALDKFKDDPAALEKLRTAQAATIKTLRDLGAIG